MIEFPVNSASTVAVGAASHFRIIERNYRRHRQGKHAADRWQAWQHRWFAADSADEYLLSHTVSGEKLIVIIFSIYYIDH